MRFNNLFFTVLLFIFSAAAVCTQAQMIDSRNYSIQKNINCSKGAVVSAHPLASMVGLSILKKGGMLLMQPLPLNWRWLLYSLVPVTLVVVVLWWRI